MKYFLVFLFAFSIMSANSSGITKLSHKYPVKNQFPTFLRPGASVHLPSEKGKSYLLMQLDEPGRNELKIKNTYTDKYGITHVRYQQYYDGYPIEWACPVIHNKEGKVISFSGNLYTNTNYSKSINISESSALAIALKEMPADLYKWQVKFHEDLLKQQTGNQDTSWFPHAEIVLLPQTDADKNEVIFTLAYKFDIYSLKPLDRKFIYISTATGKKLKEISQLVFSDTQGTAQTKYSGTQTITADSYNGSYRLRETGRGGGIQTYDLNMSSDQGTAVDFTDADNYWDNFNTDYDEVAADAHWATEKMYDYLYNSHGWNSLNNSGLTLVSYVHFNLVDLGYPNNVNAFWDGSSMNYGDGNGSTITPLTALDIAGHEMTHGVTSFSAALIYQDESGAMNEGFSDIFGTVLEFNAKPTTANWTMGEDIGYTMRSLSDPNQYGLPDTYQGTNWYTGSDDQGGVHTNCGVLCYWFYLLSEGGTGTNDLGNTYSVSGVGLNTAADITFNLLTSYLPADATYNDARFYAIQVAVDMFGPCTPEVAAVTNAMYAVGLGNPYVPNVEADFEVPIDSACVAPFTVSFNNLSNNASSFLWNFGDGTTSTLANPTHTYTSNGSYTVSLIADGGTCGVDTLTENNFISIDPANPCITYMPVNGTGSTQTACSGTLFDSGGPNGNYQDETDSYITISPTNATSISLDFQTFNIEPGSGSTCDYDYIEIFDGPNTSSSSFGQYCNTTGSPGTITSTGGSLTLHFHSDQGLNLSGFEAAWICSQANTAPVAGFSASPTSSCTGIINFTDQSLNTPDYWLWSFGDGTTSLSQNPVHNYTTSGTYNVSLYVSNSFGSDSLVQTAIITISMPETPVAVSDTVCSGTTASLTATGSGTIQWYDQEIGGNLLFTGSPFQIPVLTTTTTYYVENTEVLPSQYIGETNNTTNGAFFSSSYEHYLVFDCYTPVTLNSVEVNAESSGNRTISLRNASGTVLDSKTVNIPAGISRISLDFSIPTGTDLQLVGPLSPGLFRNDGNLSYPYTLPGILSITGSSASSSPTGYYYYFYDWEIKTENCSSARIPVEAVAISCVGINENLVHNIAIYPNPARDALTIDIVDGKIPLSILIYDGSGKIIKTETPLSAHIQLDISDISTGLYLIRFVYSDGISNYRFVKE